MQLWMGQSILRILKVFGHDTIHGASWCRVQLGNGPLVPNSLLDNSVVRRKTDSSFQLDKLP